MKRSRRVVLTLMGTATIGAVSMGFVRPSDCGPGGKARRERTVARELPRDVWRLRRRAFSIARARPCAWLAASAPLMQRIACPERDDWRATADETGFDFHTIDGERYWDERAYYAFTLDEIERQIEEPTG